MRSGQKGRADVDWWRQWYSRKAGRLAAGWERLGRGKTRPPRRTSLTQRERQIAERARWLLAFAGRNLNAFSQTDWTTFWGQEIPKMLDESAEGTSSSMYFGARPQDQADARFIQRWLRRGFTKLAEGQDWEMDFRRAEVLRVSERGRLEIWHRVILPRRAHLIAAAFDLLMASIGLLRSCDHCKRPFVVSKRQIYCSSRCSQTVRTGIFRMRHAAELSEIRHRAYVRKIERVHGPNVRVERRIRRRA